MRRVNLPTADITADEHPEGYRHGRLKVAPLIGAATMTGSYYVLPPGQANCPYHYESDEEWLLVLEGRVTVRHPEGEDALGPGDLVCFPAGPDGAHKLTNAGDEPVRMLLVSTPTCPRSRSIPTAARSASGPRAAATTSWSAATARSTTTTERCRPCAT